MDQRKLYKTIETIASQHFDSINEMLIEVLNQIVTSEEITVTGGRIWILNQGNRNYQIMYQTGNIDKIDENFVLDIEEDPIFNQISKERTILGNETNETLRSIGILKYSASGVGDKIKIHDKYYYEYLIALNSDEINEDFRITLNIIATAITAQIKQRKILASESSLKAGLDKARELQKSILPEHEYNYFNYNLFGITHPAEIVGGDFFDYLEFGEEKDRLGITVGDAASKGVSAAAEAMYISGALRMACSFEIKINPLMKKMNMLVNKIFADDKFASLFYGEISTDNSGLLLYANAGHNPPYFIRQNSDEILLLNPTGPVLGPTPYAKYTVENINFQKGDTLLIYSDGLIDSADSKFEPFGEERLKKALAKTKHLSPKEITYSILEEVLKFSNNGEYSDDKTIVVIKRIK